MARSKTYEVSFQVGATLAGSFGKVFKGASSALQELNGQMGAMGKQQAANQRLIDLRESLHTNSLKLRAAKQHLEQLNQEMSAAGPPTKQMQQQMDKAARAVEKAQLQVDKERAALHELNSKMGTAGTSTKQLAEHQKQLAAHAEKAAKAQEKLQQVVAAQDANKAKRADLRGQLFDGVALAATMAAPIKAAVEFESSMADVAKVVDFEDGEQGLKNMGQAVIDMSKRLPMAAKDIAQIVALGGQSAVAEQDLTAFAEHAVKMGTAFGMSAEEAGTSMAKMKSAFGMTIPQVAELTDKINLLGNTGAANEKQILNIVARVGPLGEVAGLASGEIAALGSTLAGMGVQEEVAATGIQNLMLALVQGEAATKGQREALKALGMDAVDVAKSMQKDAAGTMMKVFESLRGKEDWQRASIMTQLFGKESIKAIAPLLNQLETLEENFAKVGDEQKYGGAVNKEYAARAATTANQLQLAKNQVAAMGVTLGNVMLPALNDALKAFMPWMDRITGLAKEYPGLTKALVMGTGALIAAKVAAIAGGYAFTFVKGAVLSVQGGLAAARTGWLLYKGAMVATNATSKTAIAVSKAVAAGQWLVNSAFLASPIGWVVAGVVALTAAGVALYKYWEPIKAFFMGTWEGIKEGLDPLLPVLKTAFSPVIGALQTLRPLFSWLGDGISSLWNWFSGLLTPVDACSKSVANATEYGRGFGRMLGGIVTSIAEVTGALLHFVDTPRRVIMDALKRVKGFIAGFDLKESGAKLLQTLTGGIRSASAAPLAAVKTALDSATGYVVTKLGQLASWLSGFSLVQGAVKIGAGFAQAFMAFVDNPKQAIMTALQRAKDFILGFDLKESGAKLLQTLADGIKSAVAAPVEAIKGALSKVREYLPFSDAKVGPLSELTLSGQKIMDTLGEGMGRANIADVTAPLGGIAAAANGGIGGGAALGAGGGGGGGDTYNITIQVPAGADPAAARAAGVEAARSFEEEMRRHNARKERLSYAPA